MSSEAAVGEVSRRPSLFSSFSRAFSSSSAATAAPVSTADDQAPADAQPTRLKTFVKTVIWLGAKVADGVEYVGEGVVSVLGLDDSRFQDVLDNMTDEQREYAEAVHAERQQEYRDAGLLVDDVIPSDEDGAVPTTASAREGSARVVDVEAGGVEANATGAPSSGSNAKAHPKGDAKVSTFTPESSALDPRDIELTPVENNV